jgi:hypothetical protein
MVQIAEQSFPQSTVLAPGDFVRVVKELATTPSSEGAPISLFFLQEEGANIASATTTDIGAATGQIVTITGSTTITGLGTVAVGQVRICKFSGAPLLTYNAASLILPAAANYQVVAGDVFVFESLGSGNWKCIAYTLASGLAISKHVQVTVTQSATPAINTDAGDIFNITGLAQAITSLTTNLTGTPFANQMIMINITDDGTARAIARGASFVSTSAQAMATTTVLGKRLCEIYLWNGAAWECTFSTSSL